ncbi:hypothetical protein V6U71_00860 [Sphingopyxis sp. J-6]|uniref:hypothetical protein n=1 Tax=Sphingopyxis sp. J-6 TaxID=3122054 RepID=UPI003983DC5C
MRFLLPFAVFALAAAPLPAFACSPAPSYAVPTNMELVAGADMILLATVTGGAPIDAVDGPDTMRIDIKPIAALKGDLANAPATLPIAIAPDRFAIPSNPYDLANAHPLAEIGGCIRYMVPKGSRLLFFLDRREGQWVPAGGPFSRWAEDVLTDDAPWLQAVRFYIDVAELPESERTAVLAARRDEWAAKDGDPVAQLLAADVARQLAGPNKPLRDEGPWVDPDAPAETAPETE